MSEEIAGDERLFNVESSPARQQDWTADKDGRLEDSHPPERKDLRDGRDWYRVRDQEQTGSCVAYALGDGVLRWQLVEHERLQPDQWLSARYIWMASKEIRGLRMAKEEWRPTTFLEEAPTNAKDALEVVRRFGAVPSGLLHWDGKLNRGPVGEFFERAAEHRIAAYYNLHEPNPIKRERVWRQWIDQHGPILVTLTVDRHFIEGQGALREFDDVAKPFLHACALAGYDERHFFIRNSWGDGWGDGGDIAATSQWLDRAIEESYGVVL
jgi:Papain family cysteine protease